MDEEIQKRLQEQGEKIDAIYKSVRKTERYFEWTLIITIVLFVVPLIGLAFVIPIFLKTLGNLDLRSFGL